MNELDRLLKTEAPKRGQPDRYVNFFSPRNYNNSNYRQFVRRYWFSYAPRCVTGNNKLDAQRTTYRNLPSVGSLKNSIIARYLALNNWDSRNRFGSSIVVISSKRRNLFKFTFTFSFLSPFPSVVKWNFDEKERGKNTKRSTREFSYDWNEIWFVARDNKYLRYVDCTNEKTLTFSQI